MHAGHNRETTSTRCSASSCDDAAGGTHKPGQKGSSQQLDNYKAGIVNRSGSARVMLRLNTPSDVLPCTSLQVLGVFSGRAADMSNTAMHSGSSSQASRHCCTCVKLPALGAAVCVPTDAELGSWYHEYRPEAADLAQVMLLLLLLVCMLHALPTSPDGTALNPNQGVLLTQQCHRHTAGRQDNCVSRTTVCN